jgi:integral membrane sensor domain MASE1
MKKVLRVVLGVALVGAFLLGSVGVGSSHNQQVADPGTGGTGGRYM